MEVESPVGTSYFRCGFTDMNVQKHFLAGVVFLFFAGFCVPAEAQFRGRGGDGGGGRGGPGGGFRGGPGGGGPGGGFRGGPGGGFGGPPGGGTRGRGEGGRGGFDPSSFLSRLDANGNGKIDPDEQQGPAQMLIQRLQSVDSSIRPGESISLSRITDAFNKMRGGRESGSDDPRSRGSRTSAADEAMEPELLVPGFGTEAEPIPLMGFGPAAEMLSSVVVTEADLREARERLSRYDRNRDGALTKEEMTRFSGNPMDFDRNKDGRLTEKELAIRYARRREANEAAQSEGRERRRERDRDEDVEMADVYNGRKSYRSLDERKLPEGLPGFFSDKDANKDGQVVMSEFASTWDETTLNEFFKSDLNRDGVITADEAVRAVEEGNNTTSYASTSSPSSSDTGSSLASSTPEPTGAEAPEARLVSYAERIIGRYDKNNDGKLTASEWTKMLINPAAADTNRDGIVTVNEYAIWMQSRSKKK